MKLYFAGGSTYQPKLVIEAGGTRALVTFFDGAKACLRCMELFPDTFIDSGAFGAFTRDEEIDLGQYISFLQSSGASTYAALDVIGKPIATAANAKKMVEAGLSPIVAFHHGSDWSHLHDLCQTYDRIALGGLVPIAKYRTKMREHLDGCFSIISQYWPKKVHGFGIAAHWAIERYPFHSVDATSWVGGTKFLRVEAEDGRHHNQSKTTERGVAEASARSSLAFGVSLAQHAQGDTYALIRRNIQAVLQTEERITRLWAARGITWEDH